MFRGGDEETGVLREIRKILPHIAAAADETERNRGLSPALIDRLGEAGIFRMMLPRSYGGEELDFVQSMRVGEELAYADMSVGWMVMVTCGLNLNLGQFPKAAVDEVLAGGPDVRMRGATAPKGRLIEVEGGYRLSGQWPMASGSFEPEWLVAGGFIYDGDTPRAANGAPAMHLALVKAEKAAFLDTWHTLGLRGTASHDFVLDDVFVPAHHVAPMFAPSCIDTPAYRVPASIGNTAHHAGARIGCAAAALDELAALAVNKRSAFNPALRLVDDPNFKSRFGEALARLDAARAHAEIVMRELWELACSGRDATPADLARARCMLARVSTECLEVVSEAFQLASSSSIYSHSSLQRRLRDMQVAAQHAAAGRYSYAMFADSYVSELAAAQGVQRTAEGSPPTPAAKPAPALAG